MNTKPFIIAILALISFAVYFGIRLRDKHEEQVRAAYHAGQMSVLDSMETNLLDVVYEENDSLSIVTYYYQLREK